MEAADVFQVSNMLCFRILEPSLVTAAFDADTHCICDVRNAGISLHLVKVVLLVPPLNGEQLQK